MAEKPVAPPTADTGERALIDVGSREIQRITWIGAAINIFLSMAKLLAGAATGSLALVADGVHSVSDLATDVVVILATRLGSRPADEGHPWGHGKYETLAALVVAIAVAVAGGVIGRDAIKALHQGVESFPGALVLVIAAASIVGKEWLYRVTVLVGRRTGSPAVIANAWHHRSDSLSSVVVLLGGVASMAGQGHADQLAGIVVGVMVAVVGVRFGLTSLGELVEGSAGDEVNRVIGEAIAPLEHIRGWHGLRARRVGRRTYVELHLVVDPAMTVTTADGLAHAAEDEIRRALGAACHVMVHVDPDRRRRPRPSTP